MSPKGSVLIVQYPASGHINPTLPVAAELVRRGHRVDFVVPEHYRAIVEPTGARVLPYPSLIPPRWTGVRIPHHPDADQLATAQVGLIRETLTPLPSIVSGLGGERPDVIVYDVLGSAAGRMLSLAWDVPAVVTCPTFVENETFSPYAEAVAAGDIEVPDPAHPAMREVAAIVRSSLDTWRLRDVAVADFLSGADERCHLVFLPREFQPGADTFDERFHFVGPCLRSGADDGGWAPPDSGRPVVLVSLGTLGYEGAADMLRAAVRATRLAGAHAVVALGEVDPAALGPVGEHVELHRRVPQLAVLRHAAAFLSHAGMNSTMEALATGVPLVHLPQTGEQRMVAERVAELGMGRMETAPDAARLAAALHAVRAPEVAAAVAGMRAAIAAAGGAGAAADLVAARMARTSGGTPRNRR